MKKRLFAIFSAFSLVLSGCTFNDILEKIGIKTDTSSQKENDNEEDNNKPTQPCTHQDTNHDAVCDLCGHTGMSVTHVDTDHDGTCDVCHAGGIPVVHEDANGDGYCDTCDAFFHDPANVTFNTNAYEHWYVDSRGVEHREAHDFHLVNHTDMTCSETDVDEYECSKCEFAKLVKGNEFAEHHYHSEITKEPTCSEEGEVTFRCEECADTYTRSIPVNKNAHHYVEHAESGGVKTLKCDLCEDEKTFIDHSSSQSAVVTNTELQEAKEIQLQGAAISFDETTLNNDISDNVTIGAEPKETQDVVSELNLDSFAEEKLEGKPIIDLSMVDTNTDQKVSTFSGKVKVTIPYELKAGEDPNGIAIWYLSEGEPEAIKAEYLDGKVSFETTHFSYYAVVNLDVEDICGQFGHHDVIADHVNSTCHAEGYEDHVCLRCHRTYREYNNQLAEHDYRFVEMVEPTETTEGYIRRECHICHEIQDTVLPKQVPGEEERGFYENLYKSVLTPDYKIRMTANLDGTIYNEEFYTGEDEEGKYFQYSPNESSFTYKGKQYYSYSVYESYSNPYYAFGIAQVVLNKIPQIYKDKAEEIIDWVVEKYFIKTKLVDENEREYGYEIRLNNEALYQTYVDFRNNSLEDAIKLTIGEDTFKEIFNFIEDIYDRPVSEVIGILDEKGFSMEALYDSVREMTEIIAGEEAVEHMPSYDELVERIGSISVPQLLNVLISQMHVGSGSHKEETTETPQPVRVLRGENDDDEEGEGEPEQQEEIPQIVPADFESLMEIVQPFLDANLFDIISMIAEIDPENKAELIEQVDGVALEVREKLNVVVNTTMNGSFVSLLTGISELHNPIDHSQVVTNASVYVTKSFDKAGVLKTLADQAADVDRFYEAITLSSDNYKWISEPIERQLSSQYPGIKFDWVEEEDNEDSYERYKLVSKQAYNVAISESETIRGKIAINVRNRNGKSDYYGWTYYGRIVTNTQGLGTKLPKGHRGYVTNSYDFISSWARVVPTNIEDSPYDIGFLDFGILYDIDAQKWSYSSLEGNFSYLSYSYLDITNVYHIVEDDMTEREKREATQIIKWEEEDVEFFRICYGDGSTRINYIKKSNSNRIIATMPVADKRMNDEALENSRWVYAWEYTFEGKVVKHLENEYEAKVPFDFGRFYSGSIEPELNLNENYSIEFIVGNVRVTYNANLIDGLPGCTRHIYWKLYVNNTLVYSTDYKAHYDSYSICHRELSSEKIGCKVYETTDYICNCCGKKVMSETDWYYDHNYETEEAETLHEKTLTQTGFEHYTRVCQDCGDVYEVYYYNTPCQHDWFEWDENKQLYVCHDCGFESPTRQTPLFEFEKVSETDDTITFSVFTPSNLDQWFDDDRSYYNPETGSYFDYCYLSDYVFELALGYVNEEGKIVVLVDQDNKNVTNNSERITCGSLIEHPQVDPEEDDIDHFDYMYDHRTLMRTVTFDRQAFENLLAQYSESDEQLYFCLGVTYKMGSEPTGSVFYFLVERV